jgi:hypothetical protein
MRELAVHTQGRVLVQGINQHDAGHFLAVLAGVNSRYQTSDRMTHQNVWSFDMRGPKQRV